MRISGFCHSQADSQRTVFPNPTPKFSPSESEDFEDFCTEAPAWTRQRYPETSLARTSDNLSYVRSATPKFPQKTGPVHRLSTQRPRKRRIPAVCDFAESKPHGAPRGISGFRRSVAGAEVQTLNSQAKRGIRVPRPSAEWVCGGQSPPLRSVAQGPSPVVYPRPLSAVASRLVWKERHHRTAQRLVRRPSTVQGLQVLRFLVEPIRRWGQGTGWGSSLFLFFLQVVLL